MNACAPPLPCSLKKPSPGNVAWADEEREFFVDNLLVRIHLIIEMILVDRPCAMRV